MPSPFPGMDPYLENPNLWPDVHNEIIRLMRAQLMSHLPHPYVARTEVYSYTDTITDEDELAIMLPDVAVLRRDEPPEPLFEPVGAGGVFAPVAVRIANPVSMPLRHALIEIRVAATDRPVTVVELLSPVNKRPGPGYADYQEKRERLLSSGTHLLEIDLLRKGRRIVLAQPLPDAAYFVFLSRANDRPWCDIWAMRLPDALPQIPVPLLGEDPDIPLDLGAALAQSYDEARYDRSIDYTADPIPPLAAEDAAWTDVLLREKGLRS